ncbi:hypothetical protein PILCRDRAFT_819887 [Piloderma croceum F 1598]|uniref:Dienelactone hydrolase domain-containing protein n=1 Tax=Piloderma croceum (strain F 1598) TaxID=765440 RepID=A0A0C3FUM7_PILCF|nr:hypothetical protein PILCRDRAFT_819887 [Piloderma croceum F 1598]
MTSATLASVPSECCFTGFKHTGTPSGTTTTIAGVNTYVSEPKESHSGSAKVVVFFSDVYGPLYLNNQLVQDYFATCGFTVLGLDYFFGDPIQNHLNEEGWDRPAWMTKSRKAAGEFVPKWFEAVKEKYGPNAKYSAVGYCFGALYAVDLATTDSLVAAAFAHPASLEESHFEKIKAPLLMSCAETDNTFPVESRRRAEDILAQRKASYHIQVFSGVSHGFASRGDLENPTVCWAKEESARGVASWFKRFSV